MSTQYAQLVERINRIVRDRGDVELMVLLDRIADKETEAEQAASLGAVVKILNQNKKPNGESSFQSTSQQSNSTPVTQASAASFVIANESAKTDPTTSASADSEDASS